jgi:hypothetical protein
MLHLRENGDASRQGRGVHRLSSYITWNDLTRKEQVRVEKNLCPDCGGVLYAGPEGGAAQNTACEDCWQEFNFFPFGFTRMSKLDQHRAWAIYGFDAPKVKMWFKDQRSLLERARQLGLSMRKAIFASSPAK